MAQRDGSGGFWNGRQPSRAFFAAVIFAVLPVLNAYPNITASTISETLALIAAALSGGALTRGTGARTRESDPTGTRGPQTGDKAPEA